MRLLLYTLFFVLSISSIQAQNISLSLYDQGSGKRVNTNQFECISSQMDLTDLDKVAECKLVIDRQGGNNMEKTFYKLWKIANLLKANSFTIDEVHLLADNGYSILVSLYCLDEYSMQDVYFFYPQNYIVIFGDLNTKHLNKAYTCKVNDEKIKVMPYTYSLIDSENYEKIKISVGGLIGSTISIDNSEAQFIQYCSLGGSVGSSIGFAGTSKSIFFMDLSFGMFVTTILDATN